MSKFLLVFLLLYGGMNAYLFWHLRRAFPQMGWWLAAVAGLLVLMLLSPFLVRVSERAGRTGVARVLAIVGYSWMAILFWFCALALLADLWNLAMLGLSMWKSSASRLALPPRLGVAIIGVLIAAASIWSVHEALAIRLKEVTVRTPRLPAGSDPVRIVQIADLHLGLIVREGRLRRVLELVEQAEPDLLVSTGDLVDASFDSVAVEADLLAGARARLGKFAVLGNHESYAGSDNSLRFHEAAGLRVLRGESVLVDGMLRVAGVDGSGGWHTGIDSADNEDEALAAAGDRRATILLKHRPEVRETSLGRFDLQLSGHTHGGQIFPFNVFAAMANSYGPGLHNLDKGSFLYVSRGTGTWGPPMRLFQPPEVTLIILEPAGP